jgi:cyclopropane fatty-acyl-phospholipid synthase-like methyltransferase
MHGDDLAQARRARMRWNTPLFQSHAELLLDRLDLTPGTRVVDLGCGWGELLLRAVKRGAVGIGVDTDPLALQRGQALAQEYGLQAEFVSQEAADWSGTADRALCIGSSHAFGSSQAMLERLADVVPSGRVLVGDGCWAGSPSTAALDIFGDSVLPLPELVEACRTAGWRVIHMTTAGQQEWDDFESTSRAGWQEWLLANESDPRAAEVRDWLDTRERQYLHDYRGVLGFAYLVLGR